MPSRLATNSITVGTSGARIAASWSAPETVSASGVDPQPGGRCPHRLGEARIEPHRRQALSLPQLVVEAAAGRGGGDEGRDPLVAELQRVVLGGAGRSIVNSARPGITLTATGSTASRPTVATACVAQEVGRHSTAAITSAAPASAS